MGDNRNGLKNISKRAPGWSKIAGITVIVVAIYFIATGYSPAAAFIGKYFYNTTFLVCLGVGVGAQLIDGTLGMAYGISASSFLITTGVSPAAASASVHVAEVFTTGASAISHFSLKNVNRKLFLRLIFPGMAGAAIGAYALSSFDGETVKPFVAAYLLVMGIIVIKKAFALTRAKAEVKRAGLLALVGGFLDSVGGGGWGPIVTSTLLSSGIEPKYAIGTVNTVEFFVALTSAGVFTMFMGLQSITVLGGLIVGGVIAAPIGAFLVGKIKPKPLMIIVGVLIIILSLRTLLKYIF